MALKDALAADGQPNETLRRAASIYRDHLWPSQDRENRSWIVKVEPLVRKHADRLLKRLEADYHVRWPSGAILVDVCSDTGPTLAYTTGKPIGTSGHVIMDPQRCAELDVAFEITFHEASHIVDDQIVAALERAATRVNRKAPKDLWHAIIFHTAGFVASQARPDPRFVPYARRFQIFPQFQTALNEHWQPWLQRKRPYEKALEGLVQTLG